jgi:alpha-L-rhamnosidase
MKRISSYFFILLLLPGVLSCLPAGTSISVDRQTCEYKKNPLGIDMPHPRFGWNLISQERNQRQTGFEIVVSDNLKDIKANEGNMWSSGKQDSDQNIHLVYSGRRLESFTRYYWKVRVYDKNGAASPWSETAWFETALLNEKDWKAKWIDDGSKTPDNDADFYQDDPAPLFRKEFTAKKKIATARLYMTGVGYYEPYINGQKIGTQMLDPGWTTYSKQVLYAVYDVTKMLRKGKNAIGVMAGNGWYNPLPFHMWCNPDHNLRKYLDCGRPAIIAQLRITYSDGDIEEIGTDKDWLTTSGPVVRNNVYLGESYDARLEQADWSQPGAETDKWKQAVETEGPKGKLTVQMQPPIRPIERIKPVGVKEIQPGVYLYDLGVNFAGVIRIRVKGAAGTRITFRYGEDIYPDGTLNGMTSVAGQLKGCNAGEGAPHIAWQEDHYTLKGDAQGESWTPRFTFHGFRYVEVKGWPGTPALSDLEGLRLSSDVENAGNFTCSNEMFNTLQDNIRRTFRSNMFSVQSDCPAREKYAYGGDILCTAEAFLFNFDMTQFYRKTVDDHRMAQRPLGGITETAPYVGIADRGPGDGSGPLGFQLSYPFMIDRLYEFYADKRMMEEHYAALKKLAGFLISRAGNHLYDGGLSDHESLDKKPFGLTESLFYYDNIRLMAKFAALMQQQEDAAYYQETGREIGERILATYYDPETGVFANGVQTAQVFGLTADLLSEMDKKKAFSALEKAFEARNHHLSTGIYGTKKMFDLLREHDMNEQMYRIANQRDFPGWGYMIERGATSLWETWAYSDNVFSQNHPMFGSISEWFYRSLLGINPAEPGFRRILIQPQPAGDLTFAKGSYLSVQGLIGVEWEIRDETFTLSVDIPANTTAQIDLPSSSGEVIESGKVINGNECFNLKQVNGSVSLSVGSGKYQFETRYKR